jgi:hypothetical protein
VQDSVVDLATDWKASEFNIFGDGNGSEAVFNTGSTIKVKIAVTDGSTSAPTCEPDAGTTAETNNLKLKSCTASSGATPAIAFKESNRESTPDSRMRARDEARAHGEADGGAVRDSVPQAGQE